MKCILRARYTLFIYRSYYLDLLSICIQCDHTFNACSVMENVNPLDQLFTDCISTLLILSNSTEAVQQGKTSSEY